MHHDTIKSVALIGGGPAALFMLRRILELPGNITDVSIFERHDRIGPGMPYGTYGACNEHVTNISDRELPELEFSMQDWAERSPDRYAETFNINGDNFNRDKVVPRLFFGSFLEAQFDLLRKKARQKHINVQVHFKTEIADVKYSSDKKSVTIKDHKDDRFEFDGAVICIGHRWLKHFEDKVEGWYDSPYPPAKLQRHINFPVAVKGASLTAVDVVKTLARQNGKFGKKDDGMYEYVPNEDAKDFKIVMHALEGLLPAIRFHLSESALSTDLALSTEDIFNYKETHNGFLDLDYVYEKHFLLPLKEKNPALYDTVKNMSMEGFVAHMMRLRRTVEPFTLLRAEYKEAQKSIERHESVVWKETLASLSYTINYAAKHFCAEDMLRLRKTLLPLVSIIIASLPQSSCRELMALHDAGVLELVAVDRYSKVFPGNDGGAVYEYTDSNGEACKKYYKMFVDAVGQLPMPYQQFPFDSLKADGTVSAAYVAFKNPQIAGELQREGTQPVIVTGTGQSYLQVSGISINDNLQVLDRNGAANERIYIMAVPYIGGLNPDYSGLDFCEAGSLRVIEAMNRIKN